MSLHLGQVSTLVLKAKVERGSSLSAFLGSLIFLDQFLNQIREVFQTHWLAHILGRACFNAALPVAAHGKGGQSNNGHGGEARIRSQAAGRFESIHHWHLNVHQNQVWQSLFGFIQRFLPVSGINHGVALKFKIVTQNHNIRFDIFCQKNLATIKVGRYGGYLVFSFCSCMVIHFFY